MEQNLSLYKIFYEVAKAQNISKAAKELYISQPAISKSISRLEESLNAALFIRNSRGVQLTEEGQILFEHTRMAFDILNRGEEQLKQMQELGIGQLRIGASTTVCKYLLMPYLKEFINAHPHIKITLESNGTAKTLELLEHGQIDIGLVAEPKNLKGLDFFPIIEIQDGFVATQNYLDCLGIREKLSEETSLQDIVFNNATVMLLEENNVTRKFVDKYLIEQHIEPAHILEVSTMDLLIEFAQIGLGAACVIKDFVKDDIANGSLVEIPLEVPMTRRQIGFVYQKHHGMTKAVQTFIDFYKNH